MAKWVESDEDEDDDDDLEGGADDDCVVGFEGFEDLDTWEAIFSESCKETIRFFTMSVDFEGHWGSIVEEEDEEEEKILRYWKWKLTNYRADGKKKNLKGKGDLLWVNTGGSGVGVWGWVGWGCGANIFWVRFVNRQISL